MAAGEGDKIGELEKQVAVLQERLHNRDKALELQGKEYERRLQDLNHAHSLAAEKNSEYLPRSVYQKSEDELRIWREGVDRFRSESGGRLSAYASVAAFAISLLGMVLWGLQIWK